MVYRRDRVVWGAVLFRTTNPEVIEGAIVRRTERLHWTNEAAKEELLGWMQELAQTSSAGRYDWSFCQRPQSCAVIRSMLLPLGKPPRMK